MNLQEEKTPIKRKYKEATRKSMIIRNRSRGIKLLIKYNIDGVCKTRETSNFMKKGKMVISVKIRNFSRSRMTKRTSPLESSREI